MTVPHIPYPASLREGTDIINQAIDQSNQAIAKATTADITAKQALDNSDATQHQLDTIVIDGDSSVEAAQARVSTPKNKTFDVLKDRLDAAEEDHITLKAETAEWQKYKVTADNSGVGKAIPNNNANDIVGIGFYNVTGSTQGLPRSMAGSTIIASVYPNDNQQQLLLDRLSDTVFYRRKVNGVWQSWVELVTSNGGTMSGSLTLDGGTASRALTINRTVSDVVYSSAVFVNAAGSARFGRMASGGNSGYIEIEAPGRYNLDGTKLYTGTGAPDGVVAAPVGSLFLRTDGSTSTTLYVKTSGTGNTGWTAK